MGYKRLENQNGFSLLELAVSLSVMAILGAAVIPSLSAWVRIKYAEKTVMEILLVQDAARNYYGDHGLWPQTMEELTEQGYLHPSWEAANPWGDSYQIIVDPRLFNIATRVPEDLVGVLSARLPSATVQGETVSSSIPIGGFNDTLAEFTVLTWRGGVNDLPDGWQVCDGSNGTPDLRDRFVVAAGNAYGLGEIGGSLTHDHGGRTGPGNTITSWVDDHSGGDDHIVSHQMHTHSISQSNHLPPYFGLYYICKG